MNIRKFKFGDKDWGWLTGSGDGVPLTGSFYEKEVKPLEITLTKAYPPAGFFKFEILANGEVWSTFKLENDEERIHHCTLDAITLGGITKALEMRAHMYDIGGRKD